LAKGERARVLLLSQTRDQASIAKSYIEATLESNPVTKALVQSVTADTIELSNNIDIVVQAASFRSVRGFTTPLIIADEVALWRDNETSVNPAKEVFRALLPGQASVPQPLLLSISSPFAKEGVFYEFHTRHHGDNDSTLLAWQASSKIMNPTLPDEVIAAAYAEDAEAALAEFGGEFRSDIASYIDRDTVTDCIDERGRLERGRMAGVRYIAACDAAGGSGKDSYTLAIAHDEQGTAVLDQLIEVRPPFNPSLVTAELSKVLHAFGCWQVTGDRWAQGWVVQEWRKHGINYQYSTRDRSEIYLAALPLFNTGKVRLLDNPKLINQIAGLQRRTGSSGRQSVDHPKHGHDDLANAACAAIALAVDAQASVGIFGDINQVQIIPRADPAYGIGPGGAVNPATVSATLSPAAGFSRFEPPSNW